MKNKGFTLSEILITLGIAGAIAALSIPAISEGSKNKMNVTRLASTMSNVENAFSSVISNQKATDIFGTSLWDLSKRYDENDNTKPLRVSIDSDAADTDIASFVEELKQYMVITDYEKSAKSLYNKLPSGSCGYYKLNSSGKIIKDYTCSSNDPDFSKYVALKLKSGAYIILQTYQEESMNELSTSTGSNDYYISENTAAEAGISLRYIAATVFIDVNGSEPPNTAGRDIFGFVLGQNGKLYPMGGYDLAVYEILGSKQGGVTKEDGEGVDIEDAKIWSEEGATYPCNSNAKGFGCTSRLIDNDYQIDY